MAPVYNQELCAGHHHKIMQAHAKDYPHSASVDQYGGGLQAVLCCQDWSMLAISVGLQSNPPVLCAVMLETASLTPGCIRSSSCRLGAPHQLHSIL